MNILEESKCALPQIKEETFRCEMFIKYLHNSEKFEYVNISNGRPFQNGYVDAEKEENLRIHEFKATDKSFILHFCDTDLRNIMKLISIGRFHGYKLKDTNEKRDSIPVFTIEAAR